MVTLPTPSCTMPIFRAAFLLRSIIRLATNGPLSLMRTFTERQRFVRRCALAIAKTLSTGGFAAVKFIGIVRSLTAFGNFFTAGKNSN